MALKRDPPFAGPHLLPDKDGETDKVSPASSA